MSIPSLGKSGCGAPPAAATKVGSQSIDMTCASLTAPGRARPGQRTIAGTRSPPSSSSVLRPVNGQLSENRSPPLSLVKTTIVLSASPSRSSAARTLPTLASSERIIAA